MKRSEFKRRKQCRREIRRFFTATEQPYPSEEEGIPFIVRFPDYANMDYVVIAPVSLSDYTVFTFPGLSIEPCFHIEFIDNNKYKIESRIVNNPKGEYFNLYFTAVKKEV